MNYILIAYLIFSISLMLFASYHALILYIRYRRIKLLSDNSVSTNINRSNKWGIMKLHKGRMLVVIAILCTSLFSIFMIHKIFSDNIIFFYGVTEYKAKIRDGSIAATDKVKIGGYVNNIARKIDKIDSLYFTLSDNISTIAVEYNGIPPSLFQEKQQAVVTGYLKSNDSFYAIEILAKHDEKYIPQNCGK